MVRLASTVCLTTVRHPNQQNHQLFVLDLVPLFSALLILIQLACVSSAVWKKALPRGFFPSPVIVFSEVLSSYALLLGFDASRCEVSH
jgi:hypothetical protein